MSQPISRILFLQAPLTGDRHPSGYIVAEYLKRSTRALQRAAVNHARSLTIVKPLILLRVGFTKLLPSPTILVRSYRTFSPLPVLPEGNHRRYCFLFHFPSRCRARPLAGILLCGARTFLPVCLTRYAATVCPTCMKCGL